MDLTGTIPIIIDDIKKYENFEMSRCSYFSIEVDAPSPAWNINLQDNNTIPFHLLSMQGIITNYDEKGGIFKTAAQIEALFNRIESADAHMVDINDIWLPNFLFGEQLQVGNLFRISEALFTLAYQFRNSNLTKIVFLEECTAKLSEISYSLEESISFGEWAEQQISQAKDFYFQNQDMALKYDDDRGKNLLEGFNGKA